MSMFSTGPLFCFSCGAPQPTGGRIERNAVCEKCDADLRCCLNCRHHNPNAHNECNEAQAEWVRDKDRSNYCGYFDPRRGQNPVLGSDRKQEDARTRFEKLFEKD